MKYRLVSKVADEYGHRLYTPQFKKSFWHGWKFFEFYAGLKEPFYSTEEWASKMIAKHEQGRTID